MDGEEFEDGFQEIGGRQEEKVVEPILNNSSRVKYSQMLWHMPIGFSLGLASSFADPYFVPDRIKQINKSYIRDFSDFGYYFSEFVGYLTGLTAIGVGLVKLENKEWASMPIISNLFFGVRTYTLRESKKERPSLLGRVLNPFFKKDDGEAEGLEELSQDVFEQKPTPVKETYKRGTPEAFRAGLEILRQTPQSFNPVVTKNGENKK